MILPATHDAPKSGTDPGVRWPRVADLLALAMIGFAAIHGLRASRGLQWPFDIDFFRDIAIARTFEAGAPGTDPFYAGETLWYNPLVPLLGLVYARVTGLGLPAAFLQAGAWLNLLAPMAFYGMLRVLATHRVALIGLAAFLFVVPRDFPTVPLGTYSPWLWPLNFAQALFYLGVAALVIADRTRSRGWAATTGVVAGLTFLAHTAPALLLAIAALCLAVRSVLGLDGRTDLRAGRRTAVTNLLIMGASSLLLAAPFIGPLLLRYGGHIANRSPSAWTWRMMTVASLPVLLERLATVTSFVALVGVAALGSKAAWRRQGGILLAWLATCVGCLTIHYLTTTREQPKVSGFPLVPPHHFLFYLQGFKAAGVGFGVVVMVEIAAAGLRRWRRFPRLPWLPDALVLAAAALMIAWTLPAFVERSDFVVNRRAAVAGEAEERDLIAAVAFLRAEVPATAVILSPEPLGMRVAGCAGRKTVAVERLFSNPFLAWEPRARDRDALFAALMVEDDAAFTGLARRYGVTHVLATEGGSLVRGSPVLSELFGSGDLALFAVLDGRARPLPAAAATLRLEPEGDPDIPPGSIPRCVIRGVDPGDRLVCRFEAGIRGAWVSMAYPVAAAALPRLPDGSRSFEPSAAAVVDSALDGLSWAGLRGVVQQLPGAKVPARVFVRGRVEKLDDRGRPAAWSRWTLWTVRP